MTHIYPAIYHRLLAKHSGKCLDVSLAGKNNGAVVHQWECVCDDNQLWEIAPVNDGYFTILAKHSRKCLDVILAARVNDARVHQWDYVHEPNQQWQIIPVDDLYCKIVARHSGKCLQVGGVTYLGNGSAVNQLDYVDGENQKWLIVSDVIRCSSFFRIVNKQTRRDLRPHDRDNHGWRIVSVGNDQYRIEERDSGDCLEASLETQSVKPGKYVGGDNQKWRIVPAGGFCYRIISASYSYYLQANEHDVAISSSTDGKGDNQLWVLIPQPDKVFARDRSGETYVLESDHRILVPDDATLEALGGDANSIATHDDSELSKKPLWPFLQFDGAAFQSDAVRSLIKVITRVALWAGPSVVGEPIPHDAMGLLDLSTNNQDSSVGQFSLDSREDWEKHKRGVFLSHSNEDKPLARRIAADLHRAGIYVWLDEWEIRVGDSITQAIQKGLQQTDFVAVLLSRHSVESGWVEKEWQSKIGLEATQRKVIVLPLKCDDSAMPPLLSDKKFADFSRDYQTALTELIDAIKSTQARREDSIAAAGEVSSVKFITEGGTNTIFFSIANSTYGPPVTLTGIGAKSSQDGRLLASVPRIDLASLIEGAEIVDNNLAALNLSSGDFFVLGREVIRIEPGEVASFSLRLCRRSLDHYFACRLVARLIGPEGEFYLPSDCVYLLESGETYSPYGTDGGPFVLGRVLIRAAMRVTDVLRNPKRKVVYSERNPDEVSWGYHVVQIDDKEYSVPLSLLKAKYTWDDLKYRD